MGSKPYQDKGWAWVVVFGAFVVHFLTAGLEKSFSIWYIEIMELFNTSSALSASIGGLSASVRLILAPISVLLCTKFSIQCVVICGGLISFTGLLMCAFSENIFTIVVGYGIVYGFGLTLVFTPALVVCTDFFDKKRATALSLSLAGAGFGALSVPQLVVFLLERFGFKGAMMITAGFTLHFCISGAIFFTPHSNIEAANDHDASVVLPIEKSKWCWRRFSLRPKCLKLLKDSLFILFVSSFVFNMMGSGPVTTLIIHYTEELGIDLKVAVFLLAIEGAVQVVSRMLSGVFFDLSCVRKHRGFVWCFDIMLSACIVCVFSMSSSFTALIILMAFRGLTLAIYISHQTLMTCDMCEHHPTDLVPHAIGLTQFFKGIGILVGSAVSGRIKDTTGFYPAAFIFLGVAQLTGSLMALLAIYKRKYTTGCQARPAGSVDGSDERAQQSEDNQSLLGSRSSLSDDDEEEEMPQKSDRVLAKQLLFKGNQEIAELEVRQLITR